MTIQDTLSFCLMANIYSLILCVSSDEARVWWFCRRPLYILTNINQQTTKDKIALKILRSLLLTLIKHNINLRARHIPGASNVIADAISRFQWDRFRKLAPSADQTPHPIPLELLRVLNPK